MTYPPGQNKRWIDEAFAGSSSVEDIVRKLEARASGSPGEQSGKRPSERSAYDDGKDCSGREWANETLSSLTKASPTALKVLIPTVFRRDPPPPPSRGFILEHILFTIVQICYMVVAEILCFYGCLVLRVFFVCGCQA